MGRRRNNQAGNEGSECSNETIQAVEDQRECSQAESLTDAEEQQTNGDVAGEAFQDQDASRGNPRFNEVQNLLVDLSKDMSNVSGVLHEVVSVLDRNLNNVARRPDGRAEADRNRNSWSGTMRGVSEPSQDGDLQSRPHANQTQGAFRPRREQSPWEGEDFRPRSNVELGPGSPMRVEFQGEGHPRWRCNTQTKVAKITPFNGKEDWRVWMSRFEVIANRMKWSKEEKLDNLLPRIEGAAAEFVFSQLPPNVLYDYTALVAELNSRYRVIETPRTYAAKFSSRNQKKGETVEEYAAELKRLYDRAHGYRDADTRQEDLVRRFLDGLWNDEARFEVEYHKDPATIDEAVYHVVTFLHTRRRLDEYSENRPRKPLRKLEDTAKTEVETKSCDREGKLADKSRQARDVKYSNKPKVESGEALKDKVTGDQTTHDLLMSIASKLDLLTKFNNSQTREGLTAQENHRGLRPKFRCFKCGEEGHFARNCPTGSGQVTRQRGDNPFYGSKWSNQEGGSKRDHLN